MREMIVLTDGRLEEELLTIERPLLIECWAPSCRPCESQRVIIEKRAARGCPGLVLARLDAQSNPEAAAYFGLRAVPAIVLVRGGVVLERAIGLQNAVELEALIERALASGGGEELRRRAS